MSEVLSRPEQKQSNFNPPKFSVRSTEFSRVLNERVNEYFRKHGISRYGQFRMIAKLVIMVSLYLAPLVVLWTIRPESLWWQYGLWALAAVGMAGLGLTVMHDANHGVMHKRKWVNTLGREVIILLGASGLNWRIQHNVLHHTYANIDGLDEDIMAPGLFRFSPDQRRRWVHRFQFIYAWPLYSLMTISWSTYRDFVKLSRYLRKGLVDRKEGGPVWLYLRLILERSAYYTLFLVTPLLVMPDTLHVVLGFIMMHMVCSIVLTSILQSAHVVTEVSHPTADDQNSIHHGWAEHQLLTTMNFANRNRFFTWFVGGLNYQVEHHLFPHVSQVHYPKLAPIVRRTAREFSLPYHSRPTIWSALWTHELMLYRLGRA